LNIIVGVSDMKVIWDRVAHVGGMLHFMLPESSLDPEKAQANPFMFADTGIPALFKAAYALGAKKQQMKVIVVGGAQVLDQQGFFNIGKRNHMAIRKIFWKNNVMVDYENVGGNTNRTLKLAVRDGKTWLKVSGQGVTEI